MPRAVPPDHRRRDAMNDALLVKVRGKGQALTAARNAFGAAATTA